MAYAQNSDSPEAKTLNLVRCGLSEIPNEVFDCYWLEELILSNRYWDWKKREWVSFDDIGSYNLLQGALPAGFEKLKNLKKLHVEGGVT